MIETIFDKEKEELSNIINSKNILQNISYKLNNDKNSIDFFENLIDNIKNYDNLDTKITENRMMKYYFKNDFKEMYKVLNMFYRALKDEYRIKDKTAKELKKACSVFPDHIGELILILISHLPIINIFYEKIKYLEYIEKKCDLEKKSMGETILEYQEDRLFNGNSFMRTSFPEDDEFIDYEMRNKYIDNLKIKFINNNKLDKINETLNYFIDLYKNSNDLKETKLLIGMTFWDEEKNINSKNSDFFKDAMLSMSSSFMKEKKEKLEKIKLILSQEISAINNNEPLKSINIVKNKNFNFSYFIEITFLSIMNNQKIKEIEKIFIIKREYDLTNLKIEKIEKNGTKVKLMCKIELN